MPSVTQTMKLHIHVDAEASALLAALAEKYRCACNYVSDYVFGNGFVLNFMELQKSLYKSVRKDCGLKSQFAISCLKTVTARYKTVQEQLWQNPYKYVDEDGEVQHIRKTLEWLWKPIRFQRPQADFVRGRDYSFVDGGRTLSLNTLGGRVKVAFDVPECFEGYFDGTWKLGTGKLVSLNGEWYFHIPATKEFPDTFDESAPRHVVGIDRGLRFLATTYDERGRTMFIDGKKLMEKRHSFNEVRRQLQSRGTKSAKRRAKALSGRENRWMADVNHQVSKTLADSFGPGTLFVIEDLAGVSFSEENLSKKTKEQRNDSRSWAFYDFETKLSYKAERSGSRVVKVSAAYTSQRCPKCGRIHKENRDYKLHEYHCDACGYRSNDDRSAAMNIYALGTMYVSGDSNPRFGKRKTK